MFTLEHFILVISGINCVLSLFIAIQKGGGWVSAFLGWLFVTITQI